MDDRVPRRELQRRRELAGHTQESLAELIGASVTSVRSWEQGWATPVPRFRQPLADALGVSLVELNWLLHPDTARKTLDGHKVPHWLSHYDSLVLGAGRLAVVERSAVHWLLQTTGYAEAVERRGPVRLTDDQVAQRTTARLERQEVLTRDDEPLQLEILLSQTVLMNELGGPEVMTGQLDRLIRAAAMPNVELRLLEADGGDLCAHGGFELLTKSGDHEPFMAITVDVGGARYREGDGVIEPFEVTYNYLLGVALPPAETLQRIHDIKASHQ